MKKICVFGHFGIGQNLLNGQTIKTKIVYEELCKVYGQSNLLMYDTAGGFRALLKFPFQAIVAMFRCKHIIILPAHRGVRIEAPMLLFLNTFFKHSLYYIVIGGWLPSLVTKKKYLKFCLKLFSGIYVETMTMKNSLNKIGFKNIYLLPNCKELKIVDEKTIDNSEAFKLPHALCTFSRVNKKKGIEDAVNAVESINKKYQRILYTLDIYGQIDKGQELWFNALCSSFPDYICYKGEVAYDKSVSVLKNYYALLFPTQYYTEGIPGTIIDAYAAGIPVIASNWESANDIIIDKVTGYLYDFGQVNSLISMLECIYTGDLVTKKIRLNCLRQAKKFIPRNVLKTLCNHIDGGNL